MAGSSAVFLMRCVVLQQFVQGMSLISRGSLHEKLQWIFSLYDVNGDGVISKQEMVDMVTAIYDLMGRHTEAFGDACSPRDHADIIFRVSFGREFVQNVRWRK